MIDENKLLEEIKTRLLITGNYHDSLLLAYADNVKRFLLSGGVSLEILESEDAVGVIAQGVSDLYNGMPEFSNMFRERAYQLKYELMED